MAKLERTTALVAFVLAGACSSVEPPAARPLPSASAADAFVWGYPLLVSRRTMQSLGRVFGVNKLFNQTALATPSTRIIVSPNQDTLYSVAVLDLHDEPVVLTVPDVVDRYWTMQLVDAWSSTFHYIGTRTTKGLGGTFVITRPGWSGALPSGAVRVTSPTPQALILGRYLVRGAGDAENVNALDRRLVPLSRYLGAPAGDPIDLGDAPGNAQEVGASGGVVFDELGDALAANAPASEDDTRALATFSPLGVGPGAHPFETARRDGEGAWTDLFERGAKDGLARVVAASNDASSAKNGWSYRLDIGQGSSDPLLRAAVAHTLWGANVAAEALYASSSGDASGAPYTGARAYVMHFAPDALPPVAKEHGFWSVTLYGPDRFFVENTIRRYAIGDRTAGLVYGADGSLDLYVQATAPPGQEANWLPAPTGPFLLTMRMYLPVGTALAGTYSIPGVVAR